MMVPTRPKRRGGTTSAGVDTEAGDEPPFRRPRARVVSLSSRDPLGDERRHESSALARHREERQQGERRIVSLLSQDPLGDERRNERAALARHRRERQQGERGRAVDFQGRDLDRSQGGAFNARNVL